MARWPGPVALALALGAVAPPLAAQDFVRRDDRVLITSFGELAAVATGPRRVFALAAAGIIIYDFAFQRWEPPLSAASGFPAHERLTAMAYDASGDLLWVGTETGGLYSVTLGLDRWERINAIGISPVLEIVPYPREGAVYVATASEWLRLRTGSFIADPVPAAAVPPEVLAAARRARDPGDPFLEATRGRLGLDPAMRRWRITDVEPGEVRGEYWIATLGGGLVHHDTRFMRTEWLPFGLLSEGAGAIAAGHERLWFGGDGRGRRNGVASSDAGLQRWSHYDAGVVAAPSGPVMDILPAAEGVWFAAADGLFRFDPSGRDQRAAWRRWTGADGLPSDAVTALAPAAEGGIWVGTTRGLVLFPAEAAVVGGGGRERERTSTTGSGELLLPGVRVSDLATAGDTLWIAADDGLWLSVGAGTVRVQVPGATGRFTAVAAGAEVAFAAMQDMLFRRTAEGWVREPSGPAPARLGRLGRLVLGDGALWVGGERGAGRLDLESGIWMYWSSGDELPPGPVRDVLPAGEHVWLTGPAGALRMRWRH
jgi:ligand-binding sensor domain-containing protein